MWATQALTWNLHRLAELEETSPECTKRRDFSAIAIAIF